MPRSAQKRLLSQVAEEIQDTWIKPYFGAVPYIETMACLSYIDDMYYEDSAKDVVRYFLSNARNWRGDVAKRIKAELKAML